MRLKTCVFAGILLACSLSRLLSAERGQLARIYLSGKVAAPILAEVLSDSPSQVKFFDIAAGMETMLTRAEIRLISTNVTEESAFSSLGMAKVVAWQVKRSLALTNAVGKVAKVDGGTLYVNIGGNDGVTVGQELKVYRGAEEVRDPDTGRVLDRQRRLIGKLDVTEVRESVSKCKNQGDLETDYRTGDEVETVTATAVAVFPFVDTNGNQTAASVAATDQVVSELVGYKIPVVERARLGTVLTELAIQQTALFEAASAQRVGRQLGAMAVLVGTIAEGASTPAASIRLVKVETGEVIFSKTNLPVLNLDRIPNAVPIASVTSLLSGLDLRRLKTKGNWSEERGMLSYIGNGRADGMITFDREFPRQFRFELEGQVNGVNDQTLIAIYFRVGGSEFIATMAKDGSCIIVDSNDPRATRSAKYGPVWLDGKTNTVTCEVLSQEMNVGVNGKPLLHVKNERLGQDAPTSISIGVLGDWRFRRIVVSKK